MVDFAYFECHFSPRHATSSTQASAWHNARRSRRGIVTIGFLERTVRLWLSHFTFGEESRLGSALYHRIRSRQLLLHVAESGSWTPESSMAGSNCGETKLVCLILLDCSRCYSFQSCLLVTTRLSLLELSGLSATDRHGSRWRLARDCQYDGLE